MGYWMGGGGKEPTARALRVFDSNGIEYKKRKERTRTDMNNVNI
jgi:hypothetical protein